MTETEEEERNADHVSMDLPSGDSTISPSWEDIASVTGEMGISSINGFNELMIQSTINDSDGDDTKSDPSSNPKVDTYTTKGNYLHFFKQLVHSKDHLRRNPSNWSSDHEVCARNPRDFCRSPDGDLKGDCHGRSNLWRSHFFSPKEVSLKGRDGCTSRYDNTSVSTTRLTPIIQICNYTSDSPTQTGTQDIFNTIGPVGPQWISNSEKLKTFINGLLMKIVVLDPVSVKYSVAKSQVIQGLTPTRTVRWTSGVIPLSSQIQTLWTSGLRPSMQWKNLDL